MFQLIRRAVTLLAISLTALAGFGADITGSVTDASSEPMIQATVRLLAAKDSAFVKGTVTDTDGRYLFTGVKSGKYIIEASYVGYSPSYADVTVGSEKKRLDPIVLKESSVLLREVSVVGVKTPVKVMEDTVEFNADSYRTAPNAVVEDLLKRLPGVEVGSDGAITANGKSVTKILVNGKEFFGDDPTVASKNLPVEMVDKLQVVDRKSDLARLTGVDDGEEETVINLTVKKHMNQGWFGTVEGGYGTDDRYLGQLFVNRFWSDNQMTILGSANNINQLGFSDGNASRFRRFGGNTGITTSQSLGINFNVGREEIIRLGGDIMWSHTDRDTRREQEIEYLFNDSSSYKSARKIARDRGHNIRADLRLKWQPDSFNTLDFRPNLMWNRNHSESTDSSRLFAGDPLRSPVNRSLNLNDDRGTSVEFGARLIYNHNFRNHRGRSFSVMANYSHSNLREDGSSYSDNIFYQFNDSTDIYDQRSDNHTWSNTLRGRFSWTEPIGNVSRGNFLTAAYSINSRWNDADKLVYDRQLDDALAVHGLTYEDLLRARLDYAMMFGSTAEAYAASEALDNEVFNPDLSNRFRNRSVNQDIRVGFKHVDRINTLDAGLSAVYQTSSSENLINDAKSIPTRHVWNYAPYVRYRMKMGKQRSLQFNYNGRSSQPSMTQLQPVPDKSDPMNIIIGNPELDPSFSHNIRLRFQDYNVDRQRSIMLMGNFQITQNSIISRTTTDITGARTTTYTNVNGVWNGRLMNMISFPFGARKLWQFSNNFFINANRSVGFNNDSRNVNTNFGITESPALKFQPDNLQIELRPRYTLQASHNTLPTRNNKNNTYVHSYGGTVDLYYQLPFGVIINSDLTYSATSGYSDGYDTRTWMWNASLSYQLLRSKALTLTAKAYDLLGQVSSVSRSFGAQSTTDTRNNILTRYFMVTLSYKFNTAVSSRRPQGEGDFMPGPGGPGRHGGPTGGRPPRI